MGKKRVADMANESTQKPKKQMFRWEEAYTEINPVVAAALREARIKPDQLSAMADGELLAVSGITPAGLEEIRAKYPAELSAATPEPVVKQEEVKAEVVEEKPASGTNPKLTYPRHRHGRSKLYKAQKKQVDDKVYSLVDALALLRKVTYSKHKSVELHLNAKETGIRGEIKLPYSIGKDVRVAIYNAEVANDIKAGKLDFDVLLASPADMPKIAPLAKVLGPRGLMPSPKNNTITTDPEKRAAELRAGASLAYKTEPKAPLMHLMVGNLNQKDEELLANIKAIVAGINPSKIKAATIKSTMSPAIRLDYLNL